MSTWNWKEIGKTRRRAKSYVNALHKDLKKSKSRSEKYVIKASIRRLERLTAQTYRGSGFNPLKAANMIEVQLPQGKNKRMGHIQRKNFVFRQQFRRAQYSTDTGLGKYGAAKVKIFYRATQKLWDKPSVGMANRDKVILDSLGISNFAEAVDYVLKANADALNSVKGMNHQAEVTDENAGWYQGVGDDVDDVGSPEYLDYVVSVLR